MKLNMKKLAFIIVFFSLLGYTQTRYLHLDDVNKGLRFNCNYRFYWPVQFFAPNVIDESSKFFSINDPYYHIANVINYDSNGVFLDPADNCTSYKYMFDTISYYALEIGGLDKSNPVIPPLIIQINEEYSRPKPLPYIQLHHIGILTIEKENYSDSLWIAPIGYIPDSTKAFDFRNDFLESRQFTDSLKQKKYFHMSHSFYNDSMGNFLLNMRFDDSLFLVYKKDTSYATCYHDFKFIKYEIKKTLNKICYKYSMITPSECIEGEFVYIEHYGFSPERIFTCKNINVSELSYHIANNYMADSIDTTYTKIHYNEEEPQLIFKNKNIIKPYSQAIYRVNGTNSKNNKSSNVLYGKERAVRYLRKD